MRTVILRILPVVLLGLTASYDHGQTTTGPSPDANVTPAKVAGTTHSIGMPQVSFPDLPDGPHKEAFLGGCMICHTPRYVTMQPAFSKKVWTAEVEKMKKVYGAPLSDEQMPQIVEYLMSIRGAQDTAKP
jgi:mono/diheme cytochrome c family protein